MKHANKLLFLVAICASCGILFAATPGEDLSRQTSDIFDGSGNANRLGGVGVNTKRLDGARLAYFESDPADSGDPQSNQPLFRPQASDNPMHSLLDVVAEKLKVSYHRNLAGAIVSGAAVVAAGLVLGLVSMPLWVTILTGGLGVAALGLAIAFGVRAYRRWHQLRALAFFGAMFND